MPKYDAAKKNQAIEILKSMCLKCEKHSDDCPLSAAVKAVNAIPAE